MKTKLKIALAVLAISFMGATAWKYVNVARGPISIYPTTYANSQRDTIVFNRYAGLAGLSFGLHTKDSLSVTEIYVRRLVGGEFTSDSTRLVGATTNFAAGYLGSAGNPSFSASYAITLSPYCDSYVVIVVYAASNNGTSNGKVDYFFEGQNYEL